MRTSGLLGSLERLRKNIKTESMLLRQFISFAVKFYAFKKLGGKSAVIQLAGIPEAAVRCAVLPAVILPAWGIVHIAFGNNSLRSNSDRPI